MFDQKAVETPYVEGYDNFELISQGSMGFIFKARHLSTKKHLAYKVMNALHAGDKWVLSCLKNEFEISKKFDCVNLVKAHTWVKKDPGFFMDLIEGDELKYYLASKTITLKDRQTIVLGVCDALSYMHEKMSKTTLHLDIKPENVMIRNVPPYEPLKRSHVVLLDYGTSEEKIKGPKILSFKGIKDILSDQKVVGGSYLYMSPEQSRVEDLGVASDIYSLGCLMFELFAGRPPFVSQFTIPSSRGAVGLDETSLDRQELKMMHCSDLPPHPRDINEKVPMKLAQIILKCLEKVPEKRYKSIPELSMELQRLNI